jgi:multidrug efflux system membrane fusion protein
MSCSTRFTLLLVTGSLVAGCSRTPPATAAGGRSAAARAPAVAVVLGKAQRRDTPIYLNGIGTVYAFNTVTIRTQVDGQLQKVAFMEGQEVKAGDLLALVDPRPLRAALDQARAKKAEDQAQLASATVTYDRNYTLGRQGLVGQQTIDTQKASEDQMRAMVQADEAAIEQASVQLGYTEIRAPFDGRVGLRQIDVGNIVHASDANGIVVLTQLKPISVILTLPQQAWPQVQEIMERKVPIPVEAFGDQERLIGSGVLSVADNQIDSTTGTIRLKATFPNEKLTLWPGQFVNVRLRVELRKNAVVVPSSVVQRGPQGTYAFVVKGDSTVEMRPLKVGQIDGGWAVIDEGLKEGEGVVVDGQYKLQSGSTVVGAGPSGGGAGGGGAGGGGAGSGGGAPKAGGGAKTPKA